jgi:quercetin dioxygenase-like cupin family protein
MNYQHILLVSFGMAVGLCFGSGATRLIAQRPTQAKELLHTDVAGCSGREVVAGVLDLAPGDSGKHSHPGQSLTYVLEGSETWEVEGKPKVTVKPGDFLYDEPGKVHQTVSTAPLKLLVIRILEKGKSDTVRAGQ